jgi:hypothetical protein
MECILDEKRFAFYERAKKAFAVVVSGNSCPVYFLSCYTGFLSLVEKSYRPDC